MDENDPLWYDRAEPDEPAGPLLNALAGVFWMLASGLAVAQSVYGMPDRVWQRSAVWIAQRIATDTRRS